MFLSFRHHSGEKTQFVSSRRKVPPRTPHNAGRDFSSPSPRSLMCLNFLGTQGRKDSNLRCLKASRRFKNARAATSLSKENSMPPWRCSACKRLAAFAQSAFFLQPLRDQAPPKVPREPPRRKPGSARRNFRSSCNPDKDRQTSTEYVGASVQS